MYMFFHHWYEQLKASAIIFNDERHDVSNP